MQEILRYIKPTDREMDRELGFARKLVEHLKLHIPDSCEAVLTGSIAKKTFLRNKKDVDIFILFPRTVPKDALEPAIKSIMKSAFPTMGYQISYAEHPYVRFHISGRKVDLVPAYKISNAEERLSAVDRSVLHTRFVLNSLKVGQTDEILVFKQFLQSNSLYGAEIKIKGFSGYLCELLIIEYGTFSKLVKAASKWKTVFIDLKKYYKSSEISSARKRFGNFVVIDPTDKNRNVAAAVSEQNFQAFTGLCKKYLKKPSKSFFFKKPETFERKWKRIGKGKKTYVVSMPRPDIVDDVLWGQLHKLIRQLEMHMKEFEARIIADDTRHMVRLAIIMKKDRLPVTVLLEGPPLSMKKHVSEFKKVRKKTRIKNKKIYAEAKRQITKADDAIRQFFRKYSETDSHLAYPEEILIVEKK